MKALLATSLTVLCWPGEGIKKPPAKVHGPMWTDDAERTCWDSRRHAVVLARPFARALSIGLVGFVCFAVGWPVMLAGPPLLALGALGAGLSVWRWERTRVVVTTEKLFVVHGTLRRRAAAVRLARIATIEIEQSLVGRMFGYGTLIAGELEIPFVPQPRRIGTLVARLSA
jgi:PH (Pleckstrin Homology) domain-containing protein